MVPREALFVAADEPLLVYPSARAAERDLEAIDVKDGVYPCAFGPDGEPYDVRTEGNRVVITPSGGPNRPGELRLLLSRKLAAGGRSPDATASLGELVAAVWAIEAEFWREHDPYGERFGTRIPLWGYVSFFAALVICVYLAFR
jgi:hypothetical protein